MPQLAGGDDGDGPADDEESCNSLKARGEHSAILEVVMVMMLTVSRDNLVEANIRPCSACGGDGRHLEGFSRRLCSP